MAMYKIGWIPNPKIAYVGRITDTLPANAVQIATFEHDSDPFDSLGVDRFWRLYHHVRRALYHLSPRVLDMHTVTIISLIGGNLDNPLPSFTSGPLIQGEATLGSTLTGMASVLNGTISGHAWLRNGVVILNATQNIYTLIDADSGAMISYRCWATGPGGSIISTSTAVGPVDDEIISDIPQNALTFQGEPLTFQGEYLTMGSVI